MRRRTALARPVPQPTVAKIGVTPMSRFMTELNYVGNCAKPCGWPDRAAGRVIRVIRWPLSTPLGQGKGWRDGRQVAVNNNATTTCDPDPVRSFLATSTTQPAPARPHDGDRCRTGDMWARNGCRWLTSGTRAAATTSSRAGHRTGPAEVREPPAAASRRRPRPRSHRQTPTATAAQPVKAFVVLAAGYRTGHQPP